MGTPRFHRMAAYTRCLRCAGAPRRPMSGSELSLLIPSLHAALSDLGEFDHRFVQNTDVDIGLRHGPKGSALPISRNPFHAGHDFAATPVRNCYGLSGCWPPCTDLTDLSANGGFYFQAFNGAVTLPAAGYNYNSDWTPCMGLFLSRSFSRAALSFLPSSVSLFDLKARFF